VSYGFVDAAIDPAKALQLTRLALHEDQPCDPPTANALAALAAGDRVKLAFTSPNPVDPPLDAASCQPLPWAFSCEQMWVLITKRGRNGQFQGLLRNSPMAIKDLRNGDKVYFEAGHVLVIRKTHGLRSAIHRLLAWLS